MRSGRRDGAAPGRDNRRNADGTIRVYWVASKEARAAGYKPETVRIFDDDDEAIASRCRLLQAEMRAWMAERSGAAAARTRDTVEALIRAYRQRPESPYHAVKWNTRRTYDHTLDVMERGFGGTALAAIKLADVKRWYDTVRFPDGRGAGNADHVRSAHGLIAMMRRVVGFGVAAEIPECERLQAILSNTRFQAPRRRAVALELAHVEAIRTAAHDLGRPSIALGMVLQWELMLRQRDVVGEWEPVGRHEEASSAYVFNGRQWVNGLTWADISKSWVLTKRTTKTGSVVSFDLNLCPMVLEELRRVPEDKRFGPLILDEGARRPYAEFGYLKRWRKVADVAGVPKNLFNMDARAGGATEAGDAGANLSDIRPAMGHSRSETTARYVRGTALEPTRRVATLRLAHRAKTDG